LPVTIDGPATVASTPNHGPAAGAPAVADPLDPVETAQLSRLRRWGTTGTLLMAVGATSSYGAATPIPNPLDGIRILGLLSRIGPAALACSYSGIAMVVLCWFFLGRLAAPGRPRRLSRTQLWHTLVMWAVPLVVTPPIFSRDVYSYLAIGRMMVVGDNPYHQGPADALGPDDPVAHQVDGRWQHTTSPYGPTFLLLMKGVSAVTGDHVLRGVILTRLLALGGVALIVWALPRLGRRCHLDPVAVLWLGALNPLVLFHLIGGVHNEAVMLGLMLAGLEVALARPDHVRSVLGGAALISMSVGIKVTAVLALAFLAIMLARGRGGRWRDLFVSAALVGAAAVAVFVALSLLAGAGLGWLTALGTPGTVRSFLSVSTSIGLGAGLAGLLLGLGDHTDATVSTIQPVGTAVAAAISLTLMWRSWRGHIDPLVALGLSLGAFVLLGPVIQPWYLLWAALPLAAATRDPRYRRATVWLSVIFSVIVMPNGATIPTFAAVQAVAVAAVVVGGVLLVLRRTGLPVTHPVDRLSA
jgi:alpha-1,6-mannosyltransferase